MSSSLDPFLLLPNETISQIALYMPFNKIINLCLTNLRFNEAICNNEYFWQQKFYQDYGKVIWKGSWKELYKSYMNVWGFGSNLSGQLGLGDTEDRNKPTQIPNFKAKQITASSSHTAMIDMENNVWTFGANYYGQLGFGDIIDRHRPTQIPNIKAKEVSAGGIYTILIDMENNVWGFGSNYYGELGLGNDPNKYIPTQIPSLKAKQISAGSTHTVVIDLDDNVWSFGNNYYGELGHGNNNPYNYEVPTQIIFDTKALNSQFKAKQVSAGASHTVAIDMEDNVWSFGSNHSGELGLNNTQNQYTPTQIPNIKAKEVSAGENHTVLIDMENNIWTFGNNDSGQLGLGDYTTRYIPTQISNFKAKQVSAGNYCTLLIDMEDNIWSFGNNQFGILGLGLDTYLKINIPTQIPKFKAKQVSAGRDHTMMIATLVI
jgi:alpha-tubulin suppressor-like RCC1 family protein